MILQIWSKAIILSCVLPTLSSLCSVSDSVLYIIHIYCIRVTHYAILFSLYASVCMHGVCERDDLPLCFGRSSFLLPLARASIAVNTIKTTWNRFAKRNGSKTPMSMLWVQIENEASGIWRLKQWNFNAQSYGLIHKRSKIANWNPIDTCVGRHMWCRTIIVNNNKLPHQSKILPSRKFHNVSIHNYYFN